MSALYPSSVFSPLKNKKFIQLMAYLPLRRRANASLLGLCEGAGRRNISDTFSAGLLYTVSDAV